MNKWNTEQIYIDSDTESIIEDENSSILDKVEEIKVFNLYHTNEEKEEKLSREILHKTLLKTQELNQQIPKNKLNCSNKEELINKTNHLSYSSQNLSNPITEDLIEYINKVKKLKSSVVNTNQKTDYNKIQNF